MGGDSQGSGEAGGLAESGLERIRQVMAVRIIERHYSKHTRVSPDQLYMDAERTITAEWGNLTFSGASTKQISGARATPAKYMRVSKEAEPGRVARCIAKFWRVRKPSVIISVTGSAGGLDLPPRLQKAFCDGVVNAGRATDALFVTGGTSF